MKDKRGQEPTIFLNKNRRGQEVSPLPVVIGIILLLAVAVVLILGFTKGWQVFSFWIPSNNIQTLATQCNIACETQNTYDFCSLSRTVNDPAQKDGNVLGSATFKSGAALTNCSELSKGTLATTYKIPNCPGVPCS